MTATLALIVALGGTSYAAVTLPKNSVGAKQIKKNAVTSSKIKKNAVSSQKVKDGSLLTKDFKAGQIPQGPRGATGAPGPPVSDGSIGAAKITDGGLGGRDVGRFVGSTPLNFGTIALGDCASAASGPLAPIAGSQNLSDDVVIATAQASFPSDGVVLSAKPFSANQIEVTVCNVEGPANLNLGTSTTIRFLSIDVS